jgi:DinB superfamily
VDHCDECAFDYDLDALRPIDGLLRATVEPYFAILKSGAPVLRRSPAADTWSALEYASHLRDVMLVQRERVLRALIEEVPTFVPMHRDERVELERQNDQDPARVAEQLRVATDLLAELFAALDDDQLERTGIYNYPAPQERSIRWIGVHTLHECRHHLLDIEEVLELREAVTTADRSVTARRASNDPVNSS